MDDERDTEMLGSGTPENEVVIESRISPEDATEANYLHDILGVLESIESHMEFIGNRLDQITMQNDVLIEMGGYEKGREDEFNANVESAEFD
jgi:hypothetical protein